ncbi:uncharacterized protein LOC127732796 [Mytilus californianus]|uniref:uncharacterized protein LOC127732796 n=1 Tax=Mytilus californianus TaxID=6549 RepID=UPI00224508D3|nr:uncharacterized protein LOC127732796 [Mytilus californianus]
MELHRVTAYAHSYHLVNMKCIYALNDLSQEKAGMLQTILSVFSRHRCNDSDTSFRTITHSVKSVVKNIQDLRRSNRRILKIEDYINSKSDRQGFLVRKIDDIKGKY